MSKVVTLVTGGNRGMGFEIVKELSQKGQQVIVGSRDLEKGQEAIKSLTADNLSVDVVQLDVTNSESVSKASSYINGKYGYLTTLINNAGATFDKHIAPSELELSTIREDFEINYFGLIRVTQEMLPLLKKAPQAKIINISSMMGSIGSALDNNSSVYHASAVGYQSSKAAVNMFTVQLAKELQSDNLPITVNAIDPGLVATEFAGAKPELVREHGGKTVQAGVARTIELATDFSNLDTATFSNTNGIVVW
ncbi:SDR family NAD(P)-dependent oxidoreductase [Companilactobacillus nuruki]|uniref:Carbonyl reductase n=1 Tax=Companilactobacillus nuruki TaxID=1993540 RepID=A0A2N7AVG2_9LACO|nr:SDR family NAD(P)-dependent oxidoreductase [Companilactobacillus nuruki]PMD72137.1 carbonyl reductase [Companilactobacillus nuruki]